MRRIELDRGEDAFLEAARDLVRIGRVGQIAGHQRREVGARRQGREDALAVGARRGDVVTGGTRFGITMARANCRAV